MSVDAGSLNRQIVIESQTSVQDPNTGEELPTWATFATVYANVAPISAREMLLAQQIQSSMTTRITIRYLDGVNASMRIQYRNQTFNILGVIPDPESGLEWMTLTCSQGQNAG